MPVVSEALIKGHRGLREIVSVLKKEYEEYERMIEKDIIINVDYTPSSYPWDNHQYCYINFRSPYYNMERILTVMYSVEYEGEEYTKVSIDRQHGGPEIIMRILIYFGGYIDTDDQDGLDWIKIEKQRSINI